MSEVGHGEGEDRIVGDMAVERALAPLAAALTPTPPDPSLLARILTRIQATDQKVTVRADKGEWQPLLPGVSRKVLLLDRAAGRHVSLIRMEPGARYPAHGHAKDEECYVVDGAVELGTLRLERGDFHFTRAGTEHLEAVSPTGCLLYLTGAA